jgi:hypothetical protein
MLPFSNFSDRALIQKFKNNLILESDVGVLHKKYVHFRKWTYESIVDLKILLYFQSLKEILGS